MLLYAAETEEPDEDDGLSPDYVVRFPPAHPPLNLDYVVRFSPSHPPREREIFIDNLLVRVHFIIEMSRPALRRGSLNSLFHVALYLPS